LNRPVRGQNSRVTESQSSAGWDGLRKKLHLQVAVEWGDAEKSWPYMEGFVKASIIKETTWYRIE